MANSDYISREAAMNLIDQYWQQEYYAHFLDVSVRLGSLYIEMEGLPAADVRPVVLCRDCEYSYDSVGGWCCSHGICVDCIVREDFFCADGEKREES